MVGDVSMSFQDHEAAVAGIGISPCPLEVGIGEFMDIQLHAVMD